MGGLGGGAICRAWQGGMGMRALVVGASGGIGRALVAALRGAGRGRGAVAVGRRAGGDGRGLGRGGCWARWSRAFDLVVVATGALVMDGAGPEKTLKAVTAEGLAAQFAVNAIGPALVMKHALRLLPRDRVARLGGAVGAGGVDRRQRAWAAGMATGRRRRR